MLHILWFWIMARIQSLKLILKYQTSVSLVKKIPQKVENQVKVYSLLFKTSAGLNSRCIISTSTGPN